MTKKATDPAMACEDFEGFYTDAADHSVSDGGATVRDGAAAIRDI